MYNKFVRIRKCGKVFTTWYQHQYFNCSRTNAIWFCSACFCCCLPDGPRVWVWVCVITIKWCFRKGSVCRAVDTKWIKRTTGKNTEISHTRRRLTSQQDIDCGYVQCVQFIKSMWCIICSLLKMDDDMFLYYMQINIIKITRECVCVETPGALIATALSKTVW